VPIFKLDTLLENEDHQSFDIISIDTEGSELDVLLGYTKLAGKIIVVEACEPCSEEPSYDQWESILSHRGYEYARSAGVNRIYRKRD